jgi:glycosyltransferase involved in cell wall biosynthesis
LGGVDVYHATNYFLPPVRSARTAATFYDLAFLSHPEWCSPKIVRPFARGVPEFARRADALLTCSEASKRDIVELLNVPPEKVTVAYGAVDEGLAPMPRAQARALLRDRYGVDGPFAVFVGTLEPRKNVEMLLQAFERILTRVPHTLWLIGGWGWNADGIKDALERPALRDRVRKPGYVPREDLAAFYSAADALLFPSRYEGFGLPVLEALHCGCPVLTSSCSSLPEVAGDAAIYVDPDNEDVLTAQAERLLLDTGLQEELRSAGLAQARKFSWPRSAEATLGLYGRLAGCAS